MRVLALCGRQTSVQTDTVYILNRGNVDTKGVITTKKKG